jgi:hypothetical protein
VTRVVLRSLLALVLAAASVLIVLRVLKPGDLLASGSTTTYSRQLGRKPGVTGRLSLAPLIVDGRMRVFAAKRQVRADGPVDARAILTPRWSYRRWPQQLDGVVASGTTVVTRWSDGLLVAIDGRTGKIAWRAPGPPAAGYTGHTTGATTVWAPPGLHVAGGAVVVASGRELTAYDASTGTRRWQTDVPAGCADGFTTAGGQYVCPTGGYDVATGQPVASWPAGPYTPVGCDVAASRCAGLRDGAAQGWRADGPVPRRLAALDRPGSTLAAGYVFSTVTGGLQAMDLRTGTRRTYPAGEVLGVSNRRLVTLRPDRTVHEVDLGTGRDVAQFPPATTGETLDWAPGLYQLVAGHLAIERRGVGGPADPDAYGYYFSANPVIMCAI